MCISNLNSKNELEKFIRGRRREGHSFKKKTTKNNKRTCIQRNTVGNPE